MAATIIPKFEWYASLSKAAGLSPRCPIAQAELCPRYYASLSLLGSAGVTTQILESDKDRLDRKWSPFRPVVSEEEPSTVSNDGKFTGFGGFCPEVSYDIFHHFVSSLHRYSDEIDSAVAHEVLARGRADSSDPRWNWDSFTPRHYTECREFSIFSKADLGFGKRKTASRAIIRQGLSPKTRWLVFARDSFSCQYCGRKVPDVVLEVDHKISVANGGTNDVENLITACLECNRGKGTGSAE